jgi:hypothetical protein
MDDNNQEIQSLILMLTAGLEADMSQSANYQAILMLKTSLLSLGVTEAQVYKVLPLVRMSVSENCMARHGNLVKRLIGVLAQLSHKLIQQIDQDFPGQAEVMIPLLMGSSEIDLNF